MPPKGKTEKNNDNKRGSVSGFDGVNGLNTNKRIKLWGKNPPAGRWRRTSVIKIEYTYIEQSWTYNEMKHSKVHFCPWGMVDSVTKMLLNERVVNHPKFIPVDVKEAFGVVDKAFDVKDLKVTCKNKGNKGFEQFINLYCSQCEKELPRIQGYFFIYIVFYLRLHIIIISI